MVIPVPSEAQGRFVVYLRRGDTGVYDPAIVHAVDTEAGLVLVLRADSVLCWVPASDLRKLDGSVYS